jgi:hypothetical protein
MERRTRTTRSFTPYHAPDDAQVPMGRCHFPMGMRHISPASLDAKADGAVWKYGPARLVRSITETLEQTLETTRTEAQLSTQHAASTSPCVRSALPVG